MAAIGEPCRLKVPPHRNDSHELIIRGGRQDAESYGMGMLDPGRFLVSCSHCEAWPMAANVKRSSWSTSPHEVRFVCPSCRREETAIISASGQLMPIKRIDVPPQDVKAAWAQAQQRPRGRA